MGHANSGALSGAVTAGAGPLINGQAYGVALVENAALGRAASVAGGGKFANGAITGAFGYLFNNAAGTLRGAWTGAGIAGVLGAETGPVDALIIAGGRVGGTLLGGVLGDWLTGPDVVFQVPQKALDVAAQIDQTGDTFSGYKGGGNFENDGRGGGQILPRNTAEGASAFANFRHPPLKATSRHPQTNSYHRVICRGGVNARDPNFWKTPRSNDDLLRRLEDLRSR